MTTEEAVSLIDSLAATPTDYDAAYLAAKLSATSPSLTHPPHPPRLSQTDLITLRELRAMCESWRGVGESEEVNCPECGLGVSIPPPPDNEQSLARRTHERWALLLARIERDYVAAETPKPTQSTISQP